MKKAFILGAFAAVLLIACLFYAVSNGIGTGSSEPAATGKTRMPAVAGTFYPADPTVLRKVVTESLGSATREELAFPIKALMGPHAGYVYCGRTMAAAFKQIEAGAFTYDRVVMLGPSHRVRTKAAAVSSAAVWETPLGQVPVDTEMARRFVEKSDRIEFNDAAHAREHALEVQLPYLMVAAQGKPFKIVPILTNSRNPSDHEILARALGDVASDPKTLIVVSSDLSHFPSLATARKVDMAILNAVTSLDRKNLIDTDTKLMTAGYAGLDCTMCGLEATLCLERAAGALGIKNARIVSYTNSGMSAGDPNRVVGYGAVVFSGSTRTASGNREVPSNVTLGDDARNELLKMARSAVYAAVRGEPVSYAASENGELQIKAGCFVTLKHGGVLRGCIGCYHSDAPLWKTVQKMAVLSATRDSRFADRRISPSEVPDLDVEVSVLSPLRKISQPLEQIRLGRDGILIRDKGRSGTFLPQVATETGWSLEEFLGHCSRDKAGLGWDGWRSPTATIYTYTATIVQEKDVASSEPR